MEQGQSASYRYQSASSIYTMKSSLGYGLIGRELFVKERIKNARRRSTLEKGVTENRLKSGSMSKNIESFLVKLQRH
jgi:hypothetical protein